MRVKKALHSNIFLARLIARHTAQKGQKGWGRPSGELIALIAHDKGKKGRAKKPRRVRTFWVSLPLLRFFRFLRSRFQFIFTKEG
jgi:hypothetical protein